MGIQAQFPMKNNFDSMPNQAPEPKKPEYSEEDVDHLMGAFKENDAAAEDADRAKAIEGMIAETLTEIDDKEKQRNVERTGIIYTEAAKAADAVFKDNLNMAMQMAETPEGALLLVHPVQEQLQKTLDPAGGFSKLHEDPKIQQLYKVFTDKILHEAISAVTTALNRRIEAATDPAEISKLHKLIESVEGSDPGGDEEVAVKRVEEAGQEARAWAHRMSQSGENVLYRVPGGGPMTEAVITGFDIQTGAVKITYKYEDQEIHGTIDPVILKNMQNPKE